MVTGFLLYFWLIPSINFFFVKSKDNELLYDELKKFIPESAFSEAITDDFMVLSWDLNNREPYVMSKKSIGDSEKYKEYDSLSKATLLSAVNPNYFKPYGKDDSVFISGDAIAESPAMYSFLMATESGQDPATIAVFSIGSTFERPDKIPENIGVIEWVSRVTSLQGPSKRHSQDYMLNAILGSYDKSLIKFQFPISLEDEEEMANKKNRLEDLEQMTADMINENRLLIET